MDAPLKELAKLEQLSSSKGKSKSIDESLDALLQTLREAKERAQHGELDEPSCQELLLSVEAKKKDVDERQKEIYSSITRLGKALDKVLQFSSVHPELPPQHSTEIPFLAAVV